MKPNFTREMWVTSKDDPQFVYALESCGDGQKRNRFELKVGNANHQTPTPELEANARLIAAAPDLYAALEGLVDSLPNKCTCHEAYTSREKKLGYRFKDPNCMYCEFDDEIKAGQAALLRARGETL